MFCDNFVVFPYLDDVLEGDGGVFVLPGSHKAQFVRPPSLFGKYGQADRTAHDSKPAERQLAENRQLPHALPDYCLKPTVRAGDVLILPEATVHGVIPWRTTERKRRILSMRHGLQEKGYETNPDPE